MPNASVAGTTTAADPTVGTSVIFHAFRSTSARLSYARHVALRRLSSRCKNWQNRMKTEQRFRALFISDVHLGTRGCQSELLLDFLRHHVADTVYLVGDIVDGWRLRSSWYWPETHNTIVQKLLRQAR